MLLTSSCSFHFFFFVSEEFHKIVQNTRVTRNCSFFLSFLVARRLCNSVAQYLHYISQVVALPMNFCHVSGSLGTSVFDTEVYLVGASGGVYALLAAHLANVLLVRRLLSWLRFIHWNKVKGWNVLATVYRMCVTMHVWRETQEACLGLFINHLYETLSKHVKTFWSIAYF